MRFAFYSVMALQAAQVSEAVMLDSNDVLDATFEGNLDQNLAQVNAFVDSDAYNANLVDALSKVMASLGGAAPANANGAAGTGGAAAGGATGGAAAALASLGGAGGADTPAGEKKSGGKDAGTNIAITTATNQHINIFVPEDPSGKVTVKKTEGVKIVESDEDKADKNKDVKKAIGDKIKGKLVKKAMKDSSSSSSSGSSSSDSDGAKSKIKDASKKVKAAKARSKKMKKELSNAAKKAKSSTKKKGKKGKGKKLA